MKRIIIAAAMLMMFFTVPAFAADGGTYNVKYMAANPQEVYNQIAAAEYPEGGGSISKPPAVLDKDMTAYVSEDEDTRTVTITSTGSLSRPALSMRKRWVRRQSLS